MIKEPVATLPQVGCSLYQRVPLCPAQRLCTRGDGSPVILAPPRAARLPFLRQNHPQCGPRQLTCPPARCTGLHSEVLAKLHQNRKSPPGRDAIAPRRAAPGSRHPQNAFLASITSVRVLMAACIHPDVNAKWKRNLQNNWKLSFTIPHTPHHGAVPRRRQKPWTEISQLVVTPICAPYR
ncbi:uncharacterized protein LOC143270115 [Peromyscus maniculatus bairdii]|uniref:uncharacterized protein LOC143270115 n=1 Tax=Peromyscus maniculatus bairdii TaxID=230844 RepID=UPI003FD03F8C